MYSRLKVILIAGIALVVGAIGGTTERKIWRSKSATPCDPTTMTHNDPRQGSR